MIFSNWPSDIIYIPCCVRNIEEASKTLVAEFPDCASHTKISLVNANHPAYNDGKGMGLFATKLITKNTIVGEYCGILGKSILPVNGNSSYRMSTIVKGECFHIDALYAGNHTRFINDARGTGCKNNLKCGRVRDTYHKLLIAERDIYPGEELLFDYETHYWTFLKEQIIY
jgi:SET domain-containing protein